MKIIFISYLHFLSVFVFLFNFSFCDDHQTLGVSKRGDFWWSWCWRKCCCL